MPNMPNQDKITRGIPSRIIYVVISLVLEFRIGHKKNPHGAMYWSPWFGVSDRYEYKSRPVNKSPTNRSRGDDASRTRRPAFPPPYKPRGLAVVLFVAVLQLRVGGVSASSCDACRKGWFRSKESSKCRECPAGYFTDAENLSLCKGCPVGWSQKLKGWGACTKCHDGTHTERVPKIRPIAPHVQRIRGQKTYGM